MSNNYRIAEYLCALDDAACVSYCQQVGIPVLDVLPFEFESADEVYDCLKMFLSNGIPLSYLFLKSDVWSIYLKDITEERYHTAIDLVMSTGNPADIMLYFRACYRFGFPAIEDADSDVLHVLYAQAFPSLTFLKERSYDDDDYSGIIMDAIRMSGVRAQGKTSKVNLMNVTDNPAYDDLNTEKSKSIRPVVTPEEAFTFWCNSPVCRVHFSLKIDGVNTKALVDSSGLKLALSRGRAADSIDYTEAIRCLLKEQNIDILALDGRITGESFVDLESLKVIQSRYPGKDYKTPKSTAMAMLRAPDNFLSEDYKYLSFYAFNYNDIKPNQAFEALSAAGIKTPPALEFDGEDIPRTSLEEFNTWMDENVLAPLYKAGEGLHIGSDGVVMFLLADIDTERKDQYSDSNIAIKYSYWAAATYSSRVVDIIFEQRRVEASIVLLIEPVVMRDGNTATRVGVGSPDILVSDGVQVGDVIAFERKSEAYNVYLYKKS